MLIYTYNIIPYMVEEFPNNSNYTTLDTDSITNITELKSYFLEHHKDKIYCKIEDFIERLRVNGYWINSNYAQSKLDRPLINPVILDWYDKIMATNEISDIYLFNF